MDTLISNVTVVTMNERMEVLFGAYLGVTDGKISHISKVPPKGAMMGPRDAIKAKNVLDMHGITTAGSHVTWQRLTSRLCLFGEPSQEVPASVLQLRKNPTHVIISENIAATIERDELFQY